MILQSGNFDLAKLGDSLHLVAGQTRHGLAHLQNTAHNGKTSQITPKCMAQSFTSPTLLPAGLHCLKNSSEVSQLQRGSWLLPHSHANNLLLLLAAKCLKQAGSTIDWDPSPCNCLLPSRLACVYSPAYRLQVH